jgi:calcium-dependent protein kinase
VHRDLKPENILFNAQGVLKLVDFGTSKDVAKGKMRNTYGTAYYIAPEVLQGDYDIKCDIWSCGVILYIFFTGKPPFNGTNEEEILSCVKKAKYNINLTQFKMVSNNAKELL